MESGELGGSGVVNTDELTQGEGTKKTQTLEGLTYLQASRGAWAWKEAEKWWQEVGGK